MNLAGHHVNTAALAPVLLLQGGRVRRRALKLPEPEGNRSGRCGHGPPLRLLVLGDSAAAGVGAAHQQDALTGRIVESLGRQFDVRWQLFAKTGETTRSTLDKLHQLSQSQFDVAITSLGVNDVTSGIRIKRWLSLQSVLRERLREELGVRRLIVSSLPQMEKFPALPQPLRWHLGARAKLFNRSLATDLFSESDCTFLEIDSIENRELMAEDGFHPGPKAYSIWGQLAAEAISQACNNDELKLR